MTSPSSVSSSGSPKLLDQLRDRIRVKHYSIRTEQAYVQWVKRYLGASKNPSPPAHR